MTTHAPFHALRNAKAILFAFGACAAMLATAPAQAQLTAYGDVGQPTEADFNALSPTSVPIIGNPPTAYTLYQTSVGTQTLSITDNGDLVNKYLVRRNQQGAGGPTNNTFGGDFANATPLVRNVVSSASSAPADGMLITFAGPVSAFGFNFDPTQSLAPTDFTFRVFEGSASTDFTQLGVVNFGQGDGSAPFFGVRDTSGNKITSLLIFGVAEPLPLPAPLVVNNTPNDFAVGGLRFKLTSPVPEPGALALMAASTLPLGLLAARRRVRK